jgi:large subunit ribosomal protein L30
MSAATKATTLRIRHVRSAIGANPKQVGTLKALGLGRIGSSAEKAETPQLRGQLAVISHLIEVEEAS